jgi:hypothetical protein
MERPAVGKRGVKKMDVERLNLKKPNVVEVNNQEQVSSSGKLTEDTALRGCGMLLERT